MSKQAEEASKEIYKDGIITSIQQEQPDFPTIQVIKAEIERRKKSLRAGICNEKVFTRKQRNEMLVASEELNRLSRFLSSLESEKPINSSEGLEQEIIKCWQDWISPSNEQSVEGVLPLSEFAFYARHFAQWKKEQMMKDAVEGLICATIMGTNAISFLSTLPKELMAGDKVRIIIVKKDNHE